MNTKLATIERVIKIEPIDGADRIERIEIGVVQLEN